MRLCDVIEAAALRLGTQAEVARALGVLPHRVSEYKNGRRVPSPGHVAMLAGLANLSGDEARQLLATVELENPSNAEWREAMQRAFFTPREDGAGTPATKTNNRSEDTLARIYGNTWPRGAIGFARHGSHCVPGHRMSTCRGLAGPPAP